MVNTAKLIEIEAALTDDTLTDAELVEQLHAAGRPEVARVLAQATRR